MTIKLVLAVASALILLSTSLPAAAAGMTREEIIREIVELKERTRRLEIALKLLPESSSVPGADGGEKSEAGVAEKAEEDETRDAEQGDGEMRGGYGPGKRDGQDAPVNLLDRVRIGGAVEVEAVYERQRPKGERSESSSELSIATAELSAAARVTDRVNVHLLLDAEEGKDLLLDEAMVHFQAEALMEPDERLKSPWFATIGKMDIPFGRYESRMLSDTLTQELGEAKETAVLLGAYWGGFMFAAGMFDGDIKELGKDRHVKDFFWTASFSLPGEKPAGLNLEAGISYTSNIADGDGLTDYLKETFETDRIGDLVAGIGLFLSASLGERFFFEVEYVGALDSFYEEGAFKPAAWSLELGWHPAERFEFAVLYGGSDRAGNFLPKSRLGAAGIYEIFNKTTLGLEYLHDQFENHDKVDTVTSQVAVEF